MINTQELGFPLIERAYPPSIEQVEIFRYVCNIHKSGRAVKPQGAQSLDVAIEAVAGAGKSTTIIQLIPYFPPNYWVLYLTFMVSSRKDLETKAAAEQLMLENMEVPHAHIAVKSLHQLGRGFLGKVIKPELRFESGKYRNIVSEWLESHMQYYDKGFASSVVELVDKVQVRLIDPEDEDAILALIDEYAEVISIDMREFDEDGAEIVDKQWPLATACLRYTLKKGIEVAVASGIVDYIDLVWLMSSRALNKRPNFTYNVVIVDECQDTSPLEQEFAERCVRPGYGQMIVVGDPCQSIFHFKGSHMDSMAQLERRRRAAIFSLNECYRCGVNIVTEAQQYNPAIRPFIKSRPGAVENLLMGEVVRRLQDGGDDAPAVLCRRKSPLVALYIQLVKQGIRARMKGVDAGPEIVITLEKIEKYIGSAFRLAHLPQLAAKYQMEQIDILGKNAEKNEKAIEQLCDRIEMLLALFAWYEEMRGGKNLTHDDFVFNINEFFKFDEHAKILLSTIHSCKGLEFKRVFILEADDLEKRAFYSDENRYIAYVAVTRAINFLGLQVKALSSTAPVVIEEEIVDSTVEEVKEEIEETVESIEEVAPTKKAGRGKSASKPVEANGRWKQVLQGTYTPSAHAFLKYAVKEQVFTDPDTGRHIADRCNILEYALRQLPEYAIWQEEMLQAQAKEEAEQQFKESEDQEIIGHFQ